MRDTPEMSITPVTFTKPSQVPHQGTWRGHHPDLSLNSSHRFPPFRFVSYLSPEIPYFSSQNSNPADNTVHPHFDIYSSWIRVQAAPVVEQATKTYECDRELHHEVFPTLPIDLGESESRTGSVPALSPPRYPAYPALEICQSTHLPSSDRFY